MTTYRTEILVTPNMGRTPDDLLAEAMTGARSRDLGECETGTAKALRGGIVSIKITLTAPDHQTAVQMIRDAQRNIAGSTDISSMTTGRGRSHRRFRLSA